VNGVTGMKKKKGFFRHRRNLAGASGREDKRGKAQGESN